MPGDSSPTLAPGGNRRLKDMHVVSQALLRRFTDPATRKLIEYNLRYEKTHPRPPKGVGWVENYISHEPEAHEVYWNTEVETHLHEAFKSIDASTTEPSLIFTQPQQVQTFKDCIALHWARSIAYKALHELILVAARKRQKQRWREQQKGLLTAAFYDKYSLYPAGSEGLDHINDLVHEPHGVLADGSWFAGRVRTNFEKSRNFFRTQALQIGEVSGSDQLLIGDTPVLSFARKPGPWPFYRGPLFDSTTVVLPIGPRHLIGLGREQQWIQLPSAATDHFNRCQVLAAERWVMYHPSVDLSKFIGAVVSDTHAA